MDHRILLADSNHDWLKKAKHFLEQEHYTVDTATNGKDTQLFLGRNHYFAMVLSLGLKHHSGIQVLRFACKLNPNLKMIIFWDKKPDDEEHALQILEELQKYGIDNLLPHTEDFTSLKKELEDPRVREVLLPTQESSPKKEFRCDDDQFSKVKIEEFHISQAVPFDVFIRLNKSHYIKILQANVLADGKEIEQYQNNNQFEWFYFKKKDLGEYVKANNMLARELLEKSDQKCSVKLDLLKNVSEKYLEQSFRQGINTKTLEQGKAIAQNIAKLVEKENHLMQHLSFYNGVNSKSPSHTFLVTIFSIAILKKFNWQSPKTIETMALACLFHDIGLDRLPQKLLKKSFQEMNSEEKLLYKKHPQWGVEMLSNSRIITTTVKQIIHQHHEYYDGSGYPEGVSRNQIIIPANILSLVGDFVQKIIEYDILPYQAAKLFLATLSPRHYHPTILKHFINLFEEELQFKSAA